MPKKKSNKFAGRTARSMERSKSNYGYLKLPDNVNMFKPEGSTEIVFDILPYIVTDANHMDNKKYADDAVVGEEWWKRPVRVHRSVGPDELSIVCPTTVGKKCPICEYGSKRRKEGAEWEELKEIFPKNRTIFLIVLTDASQCETDYTEGEVHIMDQSDFTFLEFLEEEIKRDIDNEGFPDTADGMSLQVYWRSKKLGKNKFSEASKIDFVEREEQYDDDFVAELPGLDDILIIKEYKEIEAAYFGMEDMDDDPDPEEEPTPRRKKTARKTTRKPKKEVETEVVEEDDEVEIIDETPRKKKTTRAPRKKPPVEDVAVEEEAEEVEAVEEEPKPTPKRKPKPTPKRKPAGKKCPFELEFGVDTDEYEECDRCDIWEDCKEAKEKG